jgi:polyketide synthase 12/myxalamid-type polyketide synthase MxaB
MDRETQTALRGNKRYVPRLVAVPASYSASVEEGNNQIEMLDTSERGLIENLFWRGTAREPLSAEQVRIAVRATGLNFRDVLNALGVYADGPVPFGGECAGIVTEVGEKVERLRPGDQVLAIASNSFRSEVTANSRLVWHLPEGMSAECGASLSIAYVTAAYALKTLADLKAGQSILIHAAAGGVGLAAVHLAKSTGAEIFATAGSSRKRNFLRQLGLKHVMNSRNLDFADYIASKTKGKGVSVVLNSLTGDFVEYSIKALSQKGVFLELGRSDIWTSDDIAHCRPDVTYHSIFLTEEMTRQPERIRPIMSDILKMVGDNRLPALPIKLFPKHEVQAAFRYMSRAKHIGKIVVQWPDRYDLKRNASIVRSNGTYWITGGLGALGLFTAEWLAKNGAGHVILTSRKDPSPEADKQIDAIRQVGTRVTVMTADIALRDEVDRILMAINSDAFPLRGIIHAAGVLDDGVLKHQNWRRFETVLKPKIAGAWHMHRATFEMSLDFFVLYSSAAAVLGASGQANHCAANAFMDALAQKRRSQGLKGLSINWGAWSHAGAAINGTATARAALKGIGHFSPHTGLKLLAELIRMEMVNAVALSIDWRSYIRQTYSGTAAPLFLDNLVSSGQPVVEVRPLSVVEKESLSDKLLSMPVSRQLSALTLFVHNETLRILGLDTSDSIDLNKSLNDIGLDSLMAVELRNSLGAALDRHLPATLLFDYPTISAVSNYLADELNLGTVEQSAAAKESAKSYNSADDLLDRIASMPDDEIDQLLK